MAEAIFECYNEAGAITVSSRYPLPSLLKFENASTISDGYNAKAIINIPVVKVEEGPVVFVRPKNVGVYFSNSGYRNINGDSAPGQTLYINAITLLSQTWDWKPVAGNFDFTLFNQKMTSSGANFGIQTFDANGVLTYDAQTAAMGIVSIAKGSDWVLDKVVSRPVPFQSGYTVYVYSTPFPRNADGCRKIRNHQYTTADEFGGGSTAFGCETNPDILTCLITIDNDYPATPTEAPWVMFVKRTVV